MIPDQRIGEFRIRNIRSRTGDCILLEKGLDHLWLEHLEQEDKQAPIAQELYGRVLLSGLGVGSMAELTLANKKVTKVVVVEIAQEIIDMVKPYLSNEITVVCSDLTKFELLPGQFDSCYIDIKANEEVYKSLKEKLKANIQKVITI